MGSIQMTSREHGSNPNHESLAGLVKSQHGYQSMRDGVGQHKVTDSNAHTKLENAAIVEEGTMDTLKEICENCNYFMLNRAEHKQLAIFTVSLRKLMGEYWDIELNDDYEDSFEYHQSELDTESSDEFDIVDNDKDFFNENAQNHSDM